MGIKFIPPYLVAVLGRQEGCNVNVGKSKYEFLCTRLSFVFKRDSYLPIFKLFSSKAEYFLIPNKQCVKNTSLATNTRFDISGKNAPYWCDFVFRGFILSDTHCWWPYKAQSRSKKWYGRQSQDACVSQLSVAKHGIAPLTPSYSIYIFFLYKRYSMAKDK